MKRHTDTTSESPPGSEQPQAGGDPTLSNQRSRPKREHSGLGNSFNQYSPGTQFNSIGGPQNICSGSGPQFPGATIGTVYIGKCQHKSGFGVNDIVNHVHG
jgi:hypothetical protein